MNSQPGTNKHCLFFLLTLLAGCAVVAIVACEAIHLFLHMPNWPTFLAVGVVVAAVVAGVSHLVHAVKTRAEAGSGRTRIAH